MKSTIDENQNGHKFSRSKKVMILVVLVLGTSAMPNAQTIKETCRA